MNFDVPIIIFNNSKWFLTIVSFFEKSHKFHYLPGLVWCVVSIVVLVEVQSILPSGCQKAPFWWEEPLPKPHTPEQQEPRKFSYWNFVDLCSVPTDSNELTTAHTSYIYLTRSSYGGGTVLRSSVMSTLGPLPKCHHKAMCTYTCLGYQAISIPGVFSASVLGPKASCVENIISQLSNILRSSRREFLWFSSSVDLTDTSQTWQNL